MVIIFILLAYLLGSIPSGIWIGKYFYQIDIREHGSGNSGSTNTFRVLGKKAGIIVLLIDILKGTIPTLLANFFIKTDINPLIIGLFAILGHTFSLFANFRGGKAVATSAGVILAIYPFFLLSGILLFLILLYFSRMVSLSSMLTAFLLSLASLFLQDTIFTIFCFSLTVFIIYRHRSNIERIRQKTESKVPFGYKHKKKQSKF
ncbi:glycerol-3-phosphate 1-O-acyltransferase PlsY [Carnobacteriaceae bacterium zg-ZUI78]|uniref:glycerol-3-phosphate 1-O-acyltransferase PlsY n=1 Tax=Granulicatella sp. zg-84 TaxID=2678503 RepID=UPI0013C1BEEF|nr:glycerol-3-phosphate 1-O-acyltransferase PlsY [Granulicatella sp. zg-84]MBS4750501.1 glycerol-3-phosphate 1-O-acyltransferase PlsY [Carnobacteriaceae bacterium zg-ZUI78]NEW66104.1 glycerol-3-phosphate 1-O-acyltransferase PlsY [Granulicatella sp. zg-84]QMI85455.1 glycerol-3-phosphate 1-O-acyltransferase PlsY [Carnobacteriaceae bacterium zg-84]